MDGTLFDTVPANQAAYAVALAPYGVSLSVEDFALHCNGRYYRDFLGELLGGDKAKIDAVHDAKLAAYPALFHRIRENTALFSLLQTLRADYHTALVTSATRCSVEAILRYFHRENCFDLLLTNVEVPHKKPAPDGFLMAMEHFGVAPADTIIFEDSPEGIQAAQASGASRSQAARWIEQGLCRVNGAVRQKVAFKVSAGDALELTVPDAEETPVEKEDIPLEILYEDADLAVVVKPCGMVVHPAAGNESGTLVNALLFHMEDLSGIGGVKRPGIVHRLDKDTSGLLMVAKNDLAHQGLSDQLHARTMEKHYLAVVDGRMREPSGRVDKPIARSTKDRKRMAVDPAGREAVTEWTLLENLKNAALLDVHILTGRTHQIRVHMQSLHHPVAGDPIYGQKNGVKAPRLMLHAYTLSFTHPRTGERLSFTAPPPEVFTAAVKKWREDPAAPLPYRAAVRE